MVGGERRRGLEEERTALVGRLPALVVRIEEPVAQELELEVPEPVVIEELPDLAERPLLEDVLEVGVPSPIPLNPTRAACSHRSRRSNRLHSRPKCTSTGPEVVQ